MALLELKDLSVHFGGVKAVDHVSLSVNEGDFVGLIGPNGAGKTTVFNAISGVAPITQGEIFFDGTCLNHMRPDKIAHLGIARTFQNIRIYPRMKVYENVQIGLNSIPPYNMALAMLGLPKMRRAEKEAKEKAEYYLDMVGLHGLSGQEAGSLPYGMQRKLEIARALSTQPKLLFLDEPAAGMNTGEGAELVEFLKKLHRDTGITIVLIEHHLEVVMNVCRNIYVLNLGSLLAHGDPEAIQRDPEVIRAYLGERRTKNG